MSFIVIPFEIANTIAVLQGWIAPREKKIQFEASKLLSWNKA